MCIILYNFFFSRSWPEAGAAVLEWECHRCASPCRTSQKSAPEYIYYKIILHLLQNVHTENFSEPSRDSQISTLVVHWLKNYLCVCGINFFSPPQKSADPESTFNTKLSQRIFSEFDLCRIYALGCGTRSGSARKASDASNMPFSGSAYMCIRLCIRI